MSAVQRAGADGVSGENEGSTGSVPDDPSAGGALDFGSASDVGSASEVGRAPAGAAEPDEFSSPYIPRHGDTGEFDLADLRRALAEAEARDRDIGPSATRRPRGIVADIKDAVSLRAALLVVAVLALGIGFIASYVGGLHHPTPRDLPVDVVAPASVQSQLITSLTALPGRPLSPRLIANPATARRRVADRTSMGALVVDPTGTADTLYVASAAGPSLSAAVTKIFQTVEAGRGRTVSVVDLVPVSAEDGEGLASFYLAVGWTVTGYLIASILGVSAGSRPSTLVRAAVRLVTVALCAAVAGVVGSWLVQHVLGALPGPFWPMMLAGTLLVFAAGALTVALQIAFGVIGIGVAVLLFVILGNPSAGGAYARALLPPFWRAIGAFLPPGAGTDAARSIAYFGGEHTAQPLLILGGYCALGLVSALILALVVRPHPASAPANTTMVPPPAR